MPGVWIPSNEGELVGLRPAGYANEDELQRFVAEHPEVLAATLDGGENVAPWLLVRRELAIVMEEGDERTRWSLDHLFIDAEAVPTLVEVKRSTDPRARREVVAQMLDYAASFRAYWSADSLRSLWTESFDGAASSSSAEAAMDAFLSTTTFDGETDFWSAVQTNITGNRLRLLFVGDGLGSQLVRIIEYLNEQLQTTEVVGIDVVPHSGDDGAMLAYVPSVRGRTAAVPMGKSTSGRRTRTEFDDTLRANHGSAAVDAVDQLVDEAARLGGFPTIGTDARNPRLFINLTTTGTGRPYWPLAVNSRSGKVAIQLRWLANHPAFADEDRRAEIVERFATAIGRGIDAPRLNGLPGFAVEALTGPDVVIKVAEVLRWIAELADSSTVPEG
jgi:hypothetical protein